MERLYSYVPLSSPLAIRVLELLPAIKITAPIEVIVKETSLDKSNAATIEYEALSYAWEQPTPTNAIHCNGQTILVTQSCELALRRLRHKRSSRTLWIDAVCIDQNSTNERNHQVKLMGEIYSGAAQVVIWLGEGPACTYNSTVLRAVRCDWRLRRYQRKYASNRALFVDFALSFTPFCALTERQRRKLTSHFISATWFERIWTVQEFVFAQHAVVACGRALMKWEEFWEKWEKWDHAEGLNPTNNTRLHLLSENMVSRINMRNAILHLQKSQAPVTIRGLPGSTPYDCLFMFTGHKATDVRDKVYALYSLFINFGVPFPEPDYSKAVPEVFEAIAICAMRFTENLDFLLHKDLNLIGTPNLPSWVPDFRQSSTDDFFRDRRHHSRSSKISGDSKLSSSFYREPGVIHLKGFSIGNVLQVGEDLQRNEDYSVIIGPWNRIVCDFLAQTTDAVERQTILRNAYKIYCKRPYEPHPEMVNETAFEAWLLDKSQTPPESFNPYRGNDRLIVLSSRLLGITTDPPDPVEHGDVVILAMGSQLPLVLRKTGSRYHFVGVVIIDSIKDGQMWPKDCREEDLQDFTVC